MALQVVTANGTSLGQGTTAPVVSGVQKTVAPSQTMSVPTQIYNTPLDSSYIASQQYAAQQPQYTYADGSYAGTGSGAYAAAQASAATAAQYQNLIDQLNAQNGRLDGQLNVGLENIGNGYNQGENRLNEGLGVARRNYQTQNDQNTRSYATTRTGIQNNTRATANALQRLLGINGSGNSSAAFEQAPYAAGLQGTQQLTGAQQTYGTNQMGLKTSMEDSERQYNNNLGDLKNQRYSQENGLRASINQTRASLLDNLREAQINKAVASGANYATAQAAQGGLQSRINSLLDGMAGLGRQYESPVLRTGEVSFKAPTLSQFSLNPYGGGIQQNQPGAQAGIDPAFQTLFPKKDEDQTGGLI